jgi:flagellar biosynthesis/type III secretory pathway M-ring protein FliF/YscJ
MKSMKAFAYLLLAFVTAFGMTVPSAAQERERTTTTRTPAQEKEKATTTRDPAQPTATSNKGQTQDEARANKVESGRKQKISGTITKRDPDSFVMRERSL